MSISLQTITTGYLLPWSLECKSIFSHLKTPFTTIPILQYFDFILKTILATDAFDYIIFGILFQKVPENSKAILYPVVFLIKTISPAECNYGINDKELLAIIVYINKYHICLHALPKTFTIFTDHYNLKCFKTKILLNCQ